MRVLTTTVVNDGGGSSGAALKAVQPFDMNRSDYVENAAPNSLQAAAAQVAYRDATRFAAIANKTQNSTMVTRSNNASIRVPNLASQVQSSAPAMGNGPGSLPSGVDPSSPAVDGGDVSSACDAGKTQGDSAILDTLSIGASAITGIVASKLSVATGVVKGGASYWRAYADTQMAAGHVGAHVARAFANETRSAQLAPKYSAAGGVVAVVAGVFDFALLLASGEKAGHALIKAAAHIGIGWLGGTAAAALVVALPATAPLIVFGAATITVFANLAFDYVYDSYIREPVENIWLNTGF